MPVNVLSLFDGISCGRLALERVGIKVNKYYASELDKYASAVSSHNFPDTIHLGDVTKWREWDLPEISLLIGGSPCQGFSFAGKQLAFDDPRSKLFFEFVDILKHHKPKYFLLENVRMKQEYVDIISEYLGVEPIIINSTLVSAQNRVRYYWTNIPGITQPEDKKIVLHDILEYMSDDPVYGVIKSHGTCQLRNDKSMCLDANYWKDPDNHGQRTIILQTARGKNDGGFKALDGKVPTLTSNSWEQNNKLVHIDACEELGKADLNGHDFLKRVYSPHGKCPTLTAVCGGNQERRVAVNAYEWRKLTPVECERLQTVPDNYTANGLDIHFQKCFNNGNEVKNTTARRKICRESVKSKDVINQSQVGKLNSAISTILDSLETGQQIIKENLLIKAKNVFMKGVKESNKLLSVTALSTTKHGKDSKMQFMSNVRFVIEKSVTMDGVGCVFDMLLLRQDGETLSELKKIHLGSSNHMEMMVEDIIKQKMEDGFIELLQKKYLEESCKKERLYITLILINLIIARAIFMSAKTTHHTYLSIDSLSKLRENCLEMDLLSLEMENIIKMSNTSRYKQLGNGWTVDVIAHILSHIPGR